jgi:hypothetical protein
MCLGTIVDGGPRLDPQLFIHLRLPSAGEIMSAPNATQPNRMPPMMPGHPTTAATLIPPACTAVSGTLPLAICHLPDGDYRLHLPPPSYFPFL